MMSDNPDYILDLSNQQDPLPGEPSADGSAGSDEPGQSRKWIGVHFKCCDVYTRVWRNREGTAYAGCCPRCRRRVQVRVGPGGLIARFFEAG